MKWFWISYTSHSLLPHWGPDSEAPEIGYKWLVWLPLAKNIGPKKHSTMFGTKATISCLQVVLGLPQHLGPVLDLQINLRFLKLVWNDSPNRKTLVWYQNYVSSTIRTKVTISLHEVVLGLLQTLHPVLGLQIDLRLLKIVSNDSPYPKTFSLIPKLFL